MTLMNIKKKGGDVHGKIPTRIALVLNFRITIRGGQGVTKGFAEGKRTVPGPGKSASLDLLALEGRGLRGLR